MKTTEKQFAKVRKYLDGLEEIKLDEQQAKEMQEVRDFLDKKFAFQEIEDREMEKYFQARSDREMVWRTCLRCEEEFISEKFSNLHICGECKGCDRGRAYSEQLSAKKDTLKRRTDLSGSVNCAVTNAKNNKSKRGVPFQFQFKKKAAATKKAAKKCQ